MIAWALALALQEAKQIPLEVEVRSKRGGEVILLIRKKGVEARPLLVVRRQETMYLFAFEAVAEAWETDSITRVAEGGSTLHAEVKIERPGLYDIALGAGRTRVTISRMDFKDWKPQIDALRRGARKLGETAAQLDGTASPSEMQVDAWRKALEAERDQVKRMKTEFRASQKLLEDGITRLCLHPLLTPAKPPEEKNTPFDPATGEEQVRAMEEVIRKEASVKLLDEMALLLDKGRENKVMLWKGNQEALRAIAQAHEALAAAPEIGELIAEARKGTGPEALLEKVKAARKKRIRVIPEK